MKKSLIILGFAYFFTVSHAGGSGDSAAWVRCLGSDDWGVRLSAVKNLCAAQPEEALDQLRNGLHSEKPEVRWWSLWLPARLIDDVDVLSGILSEMSADAHPGIRIGVVAAAGRLGADKGAETTLKLITDADPNVRQAAVWMLGEFKKAESVEDLIENLDDRDYRVRITVSQALAKIGEPAVDKLIETLADTDATIRSAAARALRLMNDEAAVDALIKALEPDDSDLPGYKARWAAASLGIMRAEKATESLRETLKREISDRNPGWFSYWRDTILSTFLDLDRPYLVMEVVNALGKLKDKDSGELIIPLLNKYEDPILRGPAIMALGSIGDERAVESLTEIIDDEFMMPSVMTALAQCGDEGREKVNEMLQHEDEEYRKAAEKALQYGSYTRSSGINQSSEKIPVFNEFDSPEHVFPDILDLYELDPIDAGKEKIDEWIQLAATGNHPRRISSIRLLARSKNDRAPGVLKRLIYDSNPAVRAAAAIGLGRLRKISNARILLEKLILNDFVISEKAAAALLLMGLSDDCSSYQR